MSNFSVDGCVNCGAMDRPLHKLPAHVGTLEACAPCIAKYGLKTLADEADRIISIYKHRFDPMCICCRKPVMFNLDGSAPTLCRECITQGREILRRAHA